MIHGPRHAPPELATELVEAQIRRAQRWQRSPRWTRTDVIRHPEWQIVERQHDAAAGGHVRKQIFAWGIAAMVNAACGWILATVPLPISAPVMDDSMHLVVPTAAGDVDLSQLTVDIRTPLGDQAAWDHLDQATGKVVEHPSPLAIPATVEDFVGNPLAIKPTAGGDMVMGGQRGHASRGDGYSGAKIHGIRARGERFVFVLDNSLAMAGEAWQQARREVLAGVSRLERSQQFAVILCNGDIYPTPGQLGTVHWHKGGEGAAALLAQWLDLQVLVQQSETLAAVESALDHRGDGMYLVGGPSFSPEIVDPVRKLNRWVDDDQIKVPGSIVHAIGVGETKASASGLQQMATENGGHYFHLELPQRP